MLPHDPVTDDGGASLRRHVLIGTTALTALFGGFAWWSATTQVAGAVVASGTVIVEGGTKLVQHQTGGLVAEILVDNGDRVSAGDLLLRLDGTALTASRNIVMSQLRDAFARLGRLQAEANGVDEPIIAPGVSAEIESVEFTELLGTQRALMIARASARDGRREQMLRQIDQARSKIEVLTSQRDVSQAQLGILRTERADLDALLAGGLVNASRVNDLAVRQHELEGSIAQSTSGIGELEATIAERQAALSVDQDNMLSDILADQQVTRSEIARLLQQKVALDAQLRELDVRAPMAGVVHGSIVHTVGGVIGPGETAMTVIPPLGRTAVDVRISPLDIEAVTAAQVATLKFPGLDPRNTPDLTAEISTISPDLSVDTRTGAQFYVVRAVMSESDLGKLPANVALVAGMPVEAFVRTSDRTVLDFLVRPFADLLARAFRED